jgi:PAS domain S-box-containing protein
MSSNPFSVNKGGPSDDELSLLRIVIDAVPDPIFCKDAEGRYRLVNRAHRERIQLPEEQIYGKTVFEIEELKEFAMTYHADDELVLRTGEPLINREEPFSRPDGFHGWFLTTKLPIRSAQGKIIGLVGICRDITARKETERQSAKERAFLKTLIDAMPDLLFVKDLAGRYLAITGAAAKLQDNASNEFLGKTDFEVSTPKELAEGYVSDDRQVIETGVPIINKEELFRAADGSQGWFLTTKHPLRDESGQITGLVGIARDITQLKKDRDELDDARQRLIDHVENSPLAVVEWDTELRAVYWSKRAEEIFGWKAEETIGKHFGDWAFVHPDDIKKVSETVDRLISGRDQRNVCHNRNLRQDGEVVHCVWYNSALHDSSGKIISVLSLVQDMTEQVKAEEAARSAERERLVFERKLQESQKLESLGVLAGGVAHDFNNLLTAVLGNTTLALSELPPASPIREFLEQIETAAGRAADLCKQMLAYSGKGRFDIRHVDVNWIIMETADLLRVSIGRNASLQMNLASGLPSVQADASQIRQIVMNLVVNAAEAIGEKTGTIQLNTSLVHADRSYLSRVSLNSDLPEGQYVCIEVIDDGCGMTPAIRSRIFDPFFTTKFTGRGLGLAAVLGIVRGHRGAAEVESEPERGSKFRILLPAQQGALPPESLPSASSPNWLGQGKALVIDDEPVVRTTTARMLEALGFEVTVAVDGLEGLIRFREAPQQYTLVMLDVTMPRMNGEQAFAAMREIRPDARIIIMSGFHEQEIAERFAHGRPTAFLQKPFRLPALRAMLQAVLG